MSDWRSQFFLKQFTKKSLGLEIGPSHSPIVSKRDGYNVRSVDHADYNGLVEKYQSMGIDTSRIEEVDYVWDGKQTLSELVGKPHSFDYIIASHLIEHTTDLVTFLQDCEKLLKPAGKLCLAIPDKRYCFDYYRFPTSIASVLEAYAEKRTRHTPGKIFDAVINAAKREDRPAWSAGDPGKLQPQYPAAHALELLEKARTSKEYIDIHNWLFTPASFKLLIADLQLLGLTKLSYADELPTHGFEFFAILSPKAPPIKTPRITLANNMMNDIGEALGVPQLQAEIANLRTRLDRAEHAWAAIKKNPVWRAARRAKSLAKRLRR